MNIAQFKEYPACECDECLSMCLRPCWGTVEEIEKLVLAGHHYFLMLDFLVGDEEPIDVLCPALKGYGGQRAPPVPHSRHGCKFFKDKKCLLHDKNLKPLEGRCGFHGDQCKENDKIHILIGESWDCEEGRKLIEVWKGKVHFEESCLFNLWNG